MKKQCVVCDVEYQPPVFSLVGEEDCSPDDLFYTFAKYFFLEEDNDDDNDTRQGPKMIPLCAECEIAIRTLYTCDRDLFRIQREIKKLVAFVSSTVINTTTNKLQQQPQLEMGKNLMTMENTIIPQDAQKEDEEEEIVDKKETRKYRKRILQRFLPQIPLKRQAPPPPGYIINDDDFEDHFANFTQPKLKSKRKRAIKRPLKYENGVKFNKKEKRVMDEKENESDYEPPSSPQSEPPLKKRRGRGPGKKPKKGRKRKGQRTINDVDSEDEEQGGGKYKGIFPKNIFVTGRIKQLDEITLIFDNQWRFHQLEGEEKFQCDAPDCGSKIKYSAPKRNSNRQQNIVKGMIQHVQEKHLASDFRDDRYGKVQVNEDGKLTFLFKGQWQYEKIEGIGYKCSYCPKVVKKKCSMRDHMEIIHMTGEFKCDKCGRECVSEGRLKTHPCRVNFEGYTRSLEVTPGKYLYNNKFTFERLENGEFQCGVCPAVRSKLGSMPEHMRLYHEMGREICDKCAKSFTNKIILAHHLATVHSDARTIPCEQCGHLFKTRICLKTHIARVHHKRQYKRGVKCSCDKCGATFSNLVFLQNHKDSGRCGRPSAYACPKCPKIFSRSSQLTLHLNRHDKVYKHFCELCSKGFYTTFHLRRHLQTAAHIAAKGEEITTTTINIEDSEIFYDTMEDEEGQQEEEEEEEEEEAKALLSLPLHKMESSTSQ